jgi:hypothetical protein
MAAATLAHIGQQCMDDSHGTINIYLELVARPALSGLSLYYADQRRVLAKLRALIDFLRNHRGNAAPEAESAIA